MLLYIILAIASVLLIREICFVANFAVSEYILNPYFMYDYWNYIVSSYRRYRRIHTFGNMLKIRKLVTFFKVVLPEIIRQPQHMTRLNPNHNIYFNLREVCVYTAGRKGTFEDTTFLLATVTTEKVLRDINNTLCSEIDKNFLNMRISDVVFSKLAYKVSDSGTLPFYEWLVKNKIPQYRLRHVKDLVFDKKFRQKELNKAFALT